MFFSHKKFLFMLCISGALGQSEFISAAQDLRINFPEKLECSACLETKNPAEFTGFACSHAICTDCYTKDTFDKKPGCPLCRTPIQLASCANCRQKTYIDDQNILSCGHVFHARCINPVLLRPQPLCPSPTCRKPITLDIPAEPDNPAPPSNNNNISARPNANQNSTNSTGQSGNKRKTKVAILAKEAGVAFLVGAVTRAAWLKFVKKEKNSTKKKVACGLIALGIMGTQVALNYAHPDRRAHPELAIYSWAGGFCAGLYLANKLTAQKETK